MKNGISPTKRISIHWTFYRRVCISFDNDIRSGCYTLYCIDNLNSSSANKNIDGNIGI